MSEHLLSSIRVNDVEQLEAWWYEPPSPPPPPDDWPGNIRYVGEVEYPRVRYWLTRGSERHEISAHVADVLVRMAQIAERYR